MEVEELVEVGEEEMNGVLINQVGLGQGIGVLLERNKSNNRWIRVARLGMVAVWAHLHRFQILYIFSFRMQQLLGNVGTGMWFCAAYYGGDFGGE